MSVEVDGWSGLHTSEVALVGGTIRISGWEVFGAGGTTSLAGAIRRW